MTSAPSPLNFHPTREEAIDIIAQSINLPTFRVIDGQMLYEQSGIVTDTSPIITADFLEEQHPIEIHHHFMLGRTKRMRIEIMELITRLTVYTVMVFYKS